MSSSSWTSVANFSGVNLRSGADPIYWLWCVSSYVITHSLSYWLSSSPSNWQWDKLPDGVTKDKLFPLSCLFMNTIISAWKWNHRKRTLNDDSSSWRISADSHSHLWISLEANNISVLNGNFKDPVTPNFSKFVTTISMNLVPRLE